MKNFDIYEVLNDIELTEKEMKAYSMLGEGFKILSGLPENKGASSRLYNVKSDKYWTSYYECNEFLGKLYEIKDRIIREE